jgi:hypothetical protein
MMGQEIAFSGTISGFRPSWSERAPNVVTVGTEAANFDIVYWKRDAPPLLFDKIGSTIYAKGVVGEHNDRKQLRVNDLSMISYEPLQIAAPAAARARPTGDAAAAWRSGGGPAYTPPKVDTSGVLSPADILRTHEGKTVTTEGTVFAVREANDGVAIIVRDNRGQRIARLAPGQATPPKDAAVRVEGQVVWNDARSSPELVNARVSAR